MSDKIVCPLCYSNIYPEHEGTCPKCHHHVETAQPVVVATDLADPLTSFITFDGVEASNVAATQGMAVPLPPFVPDPDFKMIEDPWWPPRNYRSMVSKSPSFNIALNFRDREFISHMEEILKMDWRVPRLSPLPPPKESRSLTADFDPRYPAAALSEDGRYLVIDLENEGSHRYLKRTRDMMDVPFSHLQNEIDDHIVEHLDKQRVATLRREYPQLADWADEDILSFADSAHMQVKNRSYKR